MAFSRDRKVMMVAGEASGDLHGSGVVRAVRARAPEIRLYGIGGPQMQEAGFQLLFNGKDMGVTGFVEVASRLFTYIRMYQGLKQMLREDPPDLLVLIDFPEFNMRLATHAKRAGVPVLYYICPQLWAWRSGRVKKLARIADRHLVIFPFEVDFYHQAGLTVEYVGNPLLEVVHAGLGREEALAKLGLEGNNRIIGLMPGSRKNEVKRILPKMVQTAKLIKARLKKVEFFLPLAPGLDLSFVGQLLAHSPVPVVLVEKFCYDAINLADLVIVASGTATLEAALLATPMVMVYEVSPVTYALGIRLLNVQEYSLANLILGKRVVPELTQRQFTPESACEKALELLCDPELYRNTVAELRRTREILGPGQASSRVAEIVCQMAGSGTTNL